jgi:hypothetical protein
MRTSYQGSDLLTLSDSHRRILEVGSAIAPKIVEESGARTIEQGSELPAVFSDRQRRRAPGILFVVNRPNGETSWCFRPDRPNPKRLGHKYEQPAKALGGAGNVLDILPSQRHLIADTSCPVIFCEGAKKMLSLVSAAREAGEHVLVVSITGCWNWLHNGGEPIPDLLDMPLQGRKAVVMYDSDMLRKVEVQDAARRLAEYLQGRGTRTYVTYLTDAEDGSKVGADDHFARGGSFAELRLLTRRYDPDDFTLVRLSRDEELRAMLADLSETYDRMPAARQGQCADRATMRHATAEAAKTGTVHRSDLGEGIAVRLPVRRMSLQTRMGRQAQHNSFRRLARDRYLAVIPEPDHVVDKHGRCFLLFASAAPLGGSAQSGQGRRAVASPQHNFAQNKEDTESYEHAQGNANPDEYTDLYGGVHPARSPSSEVPELRAAKCIHTWGRKDGRRVVVDSEYFYRLSKTRQEILMYLLEEGGEAHEKELLARFGSKSTRLRDFRRRRLAPLMGWRYRRDKETGQDERLETGPAIIAADADGMVGIVPAWREALEEHRQATDEDGDTERQAEKYRKQSRDYRERDKSPADVQPHRLRGKDHMQRVIKDREADEERRWAEDLEEQRRRVGTTAAVFLADEMADVIGVRFEDARLRWQRQGGKAGDLWRAVRYGPYRFKREADGDQYVVHGDARTEDAYDRKVTATMDRMEAIFA